MSERPSRANSRKDYYKMHHGLENVPSLDDYVALHAEGDITDDVDGNVLDSMLEQEAAEVQAMESELARQKQREEAQKKKLILEKMEKLQALKERKAQLMKLVNKTPASSPAGVGATGVTLPTGAAGGVPQSGATGVTLPTGATGGVPQTEVKSAKQRQTEGEYANLISSIMQLKTWKLRTIC